MAAPATTVFPWECRDKEDQAKAAYELPLRRTNQTLADENMRLKKLLRENGISWSPVASAHLLHMKQMDPAKRKTRSSLPADGPGGPSLPTEVILRILKFAMKSSHPIVDPLWSLNSQNLSDKEQARGNQVAIHFLATCRAMHIEGTRYFWECNNFVFTSPQALRNFSELSPKFRSKIKHVELRIIARYYDDQRRKHKLEKYYHPDLNRDQLLKVHLRPKEAPLIRGGFRCYSWNQIVDFLTALRAPYEPAYKDKKNPRPRLFPSLESLRLDLVNFSDMLLPFSGSEMHDVTSHELGCTLNELQVTGMPGDEAGMKAAAELSGLLKDEGLYLDAPATFMAHSKYLQPLSGDIWCARVLRAWKDTGSDEDMDLDDEDEDVHIHTIGGNNPRLGALPPAPAEAGHPPSTRDEATVIWKRVPSSRNGSKRKWMQFSRYNGYEIPPYEEWDTEDEDNICPCCGDSHPGSSFLEFLMDEDMLV